MARSPVEASVLKTVTGAVTDEQDDAPSYELIGDAHIPVSRKAGRRWKAKIDKALEAESTERAKWNRSFDLYRMTGDEGLIDEGSGSDGEKYPWHHEASTDENLIRENIKTTLRNTFTRMPKIEASSTDESARPMARVVELALSHLLNRKHYPGVNGKARVRRQIVHAHLSNFGIIKLDHQEKVGSRQEAVEKLRELQEKAANAKETKELDEIYGQIEELEEQLPLYANAGMTLENVLPMRVVVDPNCTNPDLSDAMWLAEEVWINTNYLRSRYMEKGDEEGDEWRRKSDNKRPKVDADSGENEDIQTRVLQDFAGTSEERAKVIQDGMTKCWYIWDKLTRTILLFAADDWSYPLWVFQDKLKLSRFFQHHIMYFTEPVDGIVQPGEASQYAGQANEINIINRRVSFVRKLAFGAFLYNTKLVQKEDVNLLIEHLKNPTSVKAFGVSWDPDVKWEDMFRVFVPPDAQLQDLYRKDDLMRTVDRVNSTTPTMRGEQFKTNTTNKAVEAYTSAGATVVNEIADAIEEALAELAWSMAEVLVSKYTKQDIIQLIGEKDAADFAPMTVDEFNRAYSMNIVAGSMEKPTSANKKAEALQIAQAIGQIGQRAPGTSMRVIMRMLKEAFSEFLFTSEDAEMLEQEVAADLQKGLSVPGGGQPPQAPGGGGPPSPPPGPARPPVTGAVTRGVPPQRPMPGPRPQGVTGNGRR